MSQEPVTLQLHTTQERAALLLDLLTQKVKQLPTYVPERAEWLGLAVQVADIVADQVLGLAAPAGEGDGRRI